MSTASKRVLVVEDQRVVAADLEDTLTRLGYAVVGNVGSGEEAVGRALDVRPDLALMDVRLRGEMDGIQAAAAIRERLDIPVVYLTAYADEETVQRAMVTGPFGYLVKPFNERELRAAIEIAIYKHATDRQLAEERARREVAEEFKILVEGVEDYAIFLLDIEGRVTTWNTGAERIKGYVAQEIVGRHFSVFYTPEDIAAGKPTAELRAALDVGRVEDEAWRVRKDGSRFWASVILNALRDERGRVRGFAKVTRDMTERRRAELELRDAIRARDEFLQIASHELKTPLTPLLLQIDGAIRELERSPEPGGRLSSKLARAARQIARLGRLVDSLLDVSRITAGRIVLETEPLDLSEVVREVAERLRDEAAKAGSGIEIVAPRPVAGRWDRLRLEQIVSNLLSNAIKYGCGKPIEIDVRESEGTARLAVIDRGIGIDEEAQERIFQGFERAASPRHYGGLGLGLFIAREFAEAHGGTIAVRSRPGFGSTFTLVLPCVPETRPGVEPRAGHEAAR